MRALIIFVFVLAIGILYRPPVSWSDTPAYEKSNLSEIKRGVNLADSLFEAESYDSAVVDYRAALKRMKREFGESDSLYIWVLKRLGDSYAQTDRYGEAVQHYENWLTIVESDAGMDQLELAKLFGTLGRLSRFLCRHTEAESYLRRALQMLADIPNADPYDVAGYLKELGVVYFIQLRYAEAESVAKEAKRICTEGGFRETFRFAEIINFVGYLCYEQGRYNEAESLYKESMGIRIGLEDSLCSALSENWNNLGELYESQGRYATAESCYIPAIGLREEKLGPEHPFLVYALANLGELYAFLGRYAEADSLLNRTLKIVLKVYGPDHLHAAWAKSALGDLYRWQGKYETAESFYQEALETYRKLYSLSHPEVANSFRKLALLYASMGKPPKSLSVYKEMFESKHDLLQNVFSYASEDQKLRYADKYSLIDPSLLSLAVGDTSWRLKTLALETVLRGKSVVIDALAEEKEIAFCAYDDHIIRIEKQLREVSSEMAAICLASIKSERIPEEYRKRLQALHVVKDSLETLLSRSCSEFKDELAARRFTVSDIANSLPEGSVLWEFVQYEPYDFKQTSNDRERVGPPRYLALTLDHEGNMSLKDLRDAEEIDSLVSLARKRIYNARSEVYSSLVAESERRLNEVNSKLYDIIFAPLESHLGASTDIFISPDGQLNLLPFETLPCPDGKYVIEKFRISYLSSGRDLLRFKKKPESTDWGLVVADPDFDLAKEAFYEKRDKIFSKSPISFVAHEPARGVSGCLNASFNRLRHSRQEAESICKTLEKRAELNVDAYYGGDGVEEVLKNMTTPPKVLHLATHGYFCEDQDLTQNKMLENPLLRSGLALAGANRLMSQNRTFDSQAEDGILTAFEASGLNLVGTELVTLSACETGVGEVKNAEGVYGLRRAFQQAGAQTIVMSLWKVPDKETCELMDDFYKNWSSGQSKKKALRQAALRVLKDCRAKYGCAHPYLWGGFVLLGDSN